MNDAQAPRKLSTLLPPDPSKSYVKGLAFFPRIIDVDSPDLELDFE